MKTKKYLWNRIGDSSSDTTRIGGEPTITTKVLRWPDQCHSGIDWDITSFIISDLTSRVEKDIRHNHTKI